MQEMSVAMRANRAVNAAEAEKDKGNSLPPGASSFADLLTRANGRFDRGGAQFAAEAGALANKVRAPKAEKSEPPRRDESHSEVNADKREAKAEAKAQKREAKAERKEAARAERSEKPEARPVEAKSAEAAPEADAGERAEAAPVSDGDAGNDPSERPAAETKQDSSGEAQPATQAPQAVQAGDGENMAAPVATVAEAVSAAQTMVVALAAMAVETADMPVAVENTAAAFNPAAIGTPVAAETALKTESQTVQTAELQAGPVEMQASADSVEVQNFAQVVEETDAGVPQVQKEQADQLAQMLAAGTRLSVSVQAEDKPLVTQAANVGAEAAVLMAMEETAAVAEEGFLFDAESENPFRQTAAQAHLNANQGQTQAARAKGIANAAEQVAANPALVNVQNAQGQAAEAKPFAAALAQVQAAEGAQGAQGPQQNQLQGNQAMPQAAAGQQTQHQAQQANAPQAAHAPRGAVQPQQILEQVHVSFEKALKEGLDKINIQLKPASLGRIEIDIEVGQDGKAIATVTADRPETLAVLQKDSRDLEKALTDAGLKADADSLSFNLREHEQRNAEREGKAKNGRGRSGFGGDEGPAEASAREEIQSAETRRRIGRGGIDIQV